MSELNNFNDYNKELDSLTFVINNLMGKLNNCENAYDREILIDSTHSRIKRANTILKKIKEEIKKNNDVDLINIYKNHKPIINKYVLDLSINLSNNTVIEINQEVIKVNDNFVSTSEILNRGNDIQNKSLYKINHIIKEIDTTQNLGTKACKNLQIQNEQIKIVDSNIDETNDNLISAGKQLRTFTRKIASDKLILTMIFFVILSIIAIIILLILKSKKIIN